MGRHHRPRHLGTLATLAAVCGLLAALVWLIGGVQCRVGGGPWC